jgi:hypothetical protein
MRLVKRVKHLFHLESMFAMKVKTFTVRNPIAVQVMHLQQLSRFGRPTPKMKKQKNKLQSCF